MNPNQDVGASSDPERPGDRMVWVALERWLVRASTFVSFILIARLIGAADLGTAALVTSIATFTAWVAEAGAGLYIIQLKRATQRALQTVFWLNLAIGVLATGVMLAVGLIFGVLTGAHNVVLMLAALGITVVIQSASAVPAALLQREMLFRTLALRQVTATLVSIMVAILFAFHGFGAWAIVGQALTRTSIAAVILFARGVFRPRAIFDRPAARDFSRFSLRALPGQLLVAGNETVELTLLAATAGVSGVGLWSVGIRLCTVTVELTSQVFVFAAAPMITRKRDDPVGVADFLRRTSAGSLAITGSLLALLSAVSPALVPLVFGAEWTGAGLLAAMLAIRAIPESITRFQRMAGLALGFAGRDLILTSVQVLGSWIVLSSAVVVPLTVVALIQAGWLTCIVVTRALILQRVLVDDVTTYDLTFRLLGWFLLVPVPLLALAQNVDLHPIAATAVNTAIALPVLAAGIRLATPSVWYMLVSKATALMKSR